MPFQNKFCDVESLSSEPVLRFLRNQHNLIHGLTLGLIFQSAHEDAEHENRMEKDDKVSVHLATFNRQIRGLILQLVAIDFTVSMDENHVQTANEYLNVLLSTDDEHSMAILWSLMYNSISASLEIKTPAYRNFEMSRVEDVINQTCFSAYVLI